MKWQRSLRLAAVFLAMSGSLLSSETEKSMQVHWSGLKKLVGGKQVALQLAEGARVEGRIRKVTDTSLVLKVKKSSEPADYPKGTIEIARENISRIEVRGLRGNKGKQVGLTIATFAGTLFASVAAVMATGSDSGGTVGEGAIALAIPTAAAVLVYRGLAPQKVTIIEILPDYVGEGESKPISKDQSSTSPASGDALSASLIEESSAERLRRQARRAVMRQDLPIDLSSWPAHAPRSGID